MIRLLASDHLDPAELLRLALGVQTLPPIQRDHRGKPHFASGGPHFNWSHSGPYALCGVSDRPVGVDLELVRPRRQVLPRRALSPAEYRWFLDRGGRWEDFYALWTQKEARAKCSGQGLDRPVRSIAVPLPDSGAPQVLEGLTFTVYAGDGWQAALCAQATAPLEWV